VVFGQQQLGIAETDIASTAVGSVLLDGVVRLAKASGAITQGQKLWWDASALNVINAPAKNAYFIGYAAEAAGTSATEALVDLAEFAEEGARVLTLAATGNESIGAGDLLGGELTLIVPNTGAKTLAIVSVASIPPGALLRVRKTDATAQAVTLDPAGSEQIAGGSTHAAIDANNDYALFQSTGAAWVLVDSAIARSCSPLPPSLPTAPSCGFTASP
jgi:predicted RecA/RadA family phage recombinase